MCLTRCFPASSDVPFRLSRYFLEPLEQTIQTQTYSTYNRVEMLLMSIQKSQPQTYT